MNKNSLTRNQEEKKDKDGKLIVQIASFSYIHKDTIRSHLLRKDYEFPPL